MKTCTNCGERKANSEFYKRAAKRGGLNSHCKSCEYKQIQEWRSKNREKQKQIERRSRLKNTYGITEDQYDLLLRQQNGCCFVCERSAESFSTRLAVDHDHATGEIRGLLCAGCNKYLVGRHRRGTDGVRLLKRASEYLEKEYTGWLVPQKKKKRKKRG